MATSSQSLLVNRIEVSKKKRRASIPQNRIDCPHCHQYLTIKTFRRHQKLYQRSDGTWMEDGDSEDGDCVNITGEANFKWEIGGI